MSSCFKLFPLVAYLALASKTVKKVRGGCPKGSAISCRSSARAISAFSLFLHQSDSDISQKFLSVMPSCPSKHIIQNRASSDEVQRVNSGCVFHPGSYSKQCCAACMDACDFFVVNYPSVRSAYQKCRWPCSV